MTTLEGRLRDSDYRNWVKSALRLQYMRDWLVTFTELKSLELNQNVIQQLRLNRNPSVYNLCPTIGFDMRRKLISCCRNCNDILVEVMKYRPWSLDLNLKNADPTQLLHQHWQASKLFMNPGQDVNSSGPKDTDISGLLNFIDHCKVPRGYVHYPDLLKQVKDTRNRVLHTSSMKITEDDFQNVITPLLIDLLRDPGFLLTDPDAIAAVEKIREVKKADFIITQDNERKVLDDLSHEIRRMYNLTTDEMKTLNDRIDTLNKNLSTLESGNQEEINELRGDLKNNNTEVSKVRHMCEMLKTLVEQSTDIHDKMRQQLNDIQEQTNSTNESHETLQPRVVELERKLSDMQEQIDNIIEEQTNIKESQTEDRKDISILYKCQDNLSEEQTKLKEGQIEYSKDITKLKECQIDDRKDISKLNKGRVEDRKDIHVLYRRQNDLSEEQTKLRISVDEVKGENKTHIPSEEDKTRLRQYLIEGYKQGLDVTLLPDWEQVHVSEIFTPSIIVADQNLGSYREMFYNGNKLERRVFLLGEAGAGKTTFCKHLTDVWCDTKALPQFSDVDVLKNFQYFFYVSCRFSDEMDTVLDMINNQLFDDVKMKEIALYVLKNCPECCLILLDGADEWTGSPTSETGRRGDIAGLPGLAGVEGCVILITSRPWRFHTLSKKTQKIFKCLKINGIKDLEDLTTRILQQLEDQHPKLSSRRFLQQVREKNMSELMKIPLILIIALGSWVDDKSLHRSITLNYINMIQSFISRSKGQAGWSDPESKLRRLIPNLDKLETKWELESNKLPDIFLRYESIQKFAGLLLCLGEIAFDLLLGKEEHSLVFSKQVLKKYPHINDVSVNVCLALGILSKTETTTRGIKKLDNYTFCHKTFQEFFSALWLASKYTNEKMKLYKCIRHVYDLYRYEMLITFLCELDQDTGKQFWIDIAEKEEIEEWVEWKRQHLQTLACKHMKKLRFKLNDQTSNQVHFCVPHIHIDEHTSNEDVILLCHVMEEYPCNVKSLYMVRRQFEQETLGIYKSTSACCGLQSLTLKYLQSFSEYSDSEHSDSLEFLQSVCEPSDSLSYPVLDLQKHNKLVKLELHEVSIEGLLLPMEGARITTLELDVVTMTHQGLEQLSGYLSSCSVLENLGLNELGCREHSDFCCMPVLNLLKHNKLEKLKLQDSYFEGLLLSSEGARITTMELYNITMVHLLLPDKGDRITSLYLDDVTMDHHGLEQLSGSLLTSSGLEYLYLDKVRCSEHSDSCCIPVLNLLKHNKLENIELYHLSVEGLLLPVDGNRITSLHLGKITMTHHGLEQLSGSLSCSSGLEPISLNELRCREHSDSCCLPALDLQKHTLENLSLENLSVKGLQLPLEGARITSLWLVNVTMVHHGLEQLSESLSACSSLETLNLNEVRCGEDSDSCCIPVVNLLKHNKVESLMLQHLSIGSFLLPVEGAKISFLILKDLTMAHHGLEQLWNFLSSCSSLELSMLLVRCREHSDSSCQLVLDLNNYAFSSPYLLGSDSETSDNDTATSDTDFVE